MDGAVGGINQGGGVMTVGGRTTTGPPGRPVSSIVKDPGAVIRRHMAVSRTAGVVATGRGRNVVMQVTELAGYRGAVAGGTVTTTVAAVDPCMVTTVAQAIVLAGGAGAGGLNDTTHTGRCVEGMAGKAAEVVVDLGGGGEIGRGDGIPGRTAAGSIVAGSTVGGIDRNHVRMAVQSSVAGAVRTAGGST